jgi:NADPH:quinone reductase-like Zn-dependent oxidoreductase
MVGGSRSAIFQALFIGPLISLAGSKKMGLMALKPNNREDLDFIKELVESGELVPIIDRCYQLNEVAQAFQYFEEGHPQGKIVITMGHNNGT